MNAAVLVVYAILIALVLLASATLLERALTGLRLPARWVWVGALALSVWLPLASLASGARVQSGAEADTLTEGAAPISRIVVVDLPAAGVETANAGAVLQRLGDWRLAVSRTLDSGAASLPKVGLTPTGIAGIWGAASLIVALILTVSLLRLGRRASGWSDENLLGRRVKVSPDLGPATIGVLDPSIVIPRWARELPSHELEIILRHEEEHVRSRDTLVLAIGMLAIAVCPWNPVVWWQARRMKAAVELDCDRRVLREGISPSQYGNLLVALGSRGRIGSLVVPSMAGSTSLLERRLTIMNKAQDRTSVSGVLVTMAMALMLVVVACTTDAPVATNADGASGVVASAEIDANASGAAEARGEEVVAAIWVDRDGTVQVNSVVHPLEDVATAVAPLYEEGGVVSIEAHEAAPYRVLAGIQEQLRAAGLLRVVFVAVESEAQRSPARDVDSVVNRGLAVVLPDTTVVMIQGPPVLLPDTASVRDPRQVQINPRNLLYLDVLPTGRVVVQRGWDPDVRQMVLPETVEALWRILVGQNPNLIALVKTHPDAEYRHMYDVLGALQRANATRFSLQLAE